MKKTRIFFFRVFTLLLLIIVIEAAGYFGLWFNSRSFDYLSNKNYFRIRDMLAGNKNPEHFPRYLSVPYLGYIPYPLYVSRGFTQHNIDGYRGSRVPLKKSKNLRIVCLGGSTTYGLGVDAPEETYPAQLQQLLNEAIQRDSTLRSRYTGAEVINAGIEAGTSAEELQQYNFKYSYYQPDAVVVNSGINDALLTATATTDFQPDYTHYRRINFHLEPLRAPARWMLKSYFFSYLAVQFFYSDFSGRQDEFAHQRDVTFPQWSKLNPDSVIASGQYENYPFYNNTRRLYASVQSDSALLFVLPNVLNKNSVLAVENKKYRDMVALNETLSKMLVEEYDGAWAPFSFDSIVNKSSWIDDCHLNATGENNKARVLLPVIIKTLRQKIISRQDTAR